jgi:hypothetical protein
MTTDANQKNKQILVDVLCDLATLAGIDVADDDDLMRIDTLENLSSWVAAEVNRQGHVSATFRASHTLHRRTY